MTYFNFLIKFILFPLLIFLLVTLIDGRQGKTARSLLNGRAVWMAIGLHVLLAVVYTTPWDNYLVATGVWYYDPELISGIILAWVPLEEYTFFVLETILTGLWWWFLARRLPPSVVFKPDGKTRLISTVLLGIIWLWGVYALVSGWEPVTYLAIILAWALPPIMIQLAFGADILWHYRKIVALTILPLFVYLSAADSLAISSGTWTINPGKSSGLFIGTLPVEEAVFFLVTVTLISFGLTLSLAHASQKRWAGWANRMSRTRHQISLKRAVEE